MISGQVYHPDIFHFLCPKNTQLNLNSEIINMPIIEDLYF